MTFKVIAMPANRFRFLTDSELTVANAAYAKMKTKILQYGLSLLKGEPDER